MPQRFRIEPRYMPPKEAACLLSMSLGALKPPFRSYGRVTLILAILTGSRSSDGVMLIRICLDMAQRWSHETLRTLPKIASPLFVGGPHDPHQKY